MALTDQQQAIKDAKDIQAMDTVVLKALEMLLGAGGHQAGLTGLGVAIKDNLGNAFKVGAGVAADFRHTGYKDVTMDAFGKGLQRVMDDHFLALKLLEGTENFDYSMHQKIEDPANRNHILRVLGFRKNEIKEINIQIGEDIKGDTVMDFVTAAIAKRKINNPQYTAIQKQKIEFMVNGAMCYLPFSEPYDGKKFYMPMKNTKGEYQRVQMQVEKINMSPGFEGPYYALNLKAVDNEENKAYGYIQEHTIFMGTNPLPTASGPSVTLHADAIPNKNVGENFVEASNDMFENRFKQSFKDNLKQLILLAQDPDNVAFRDNEGNINYDKIWLDARVKCVGQSLGGSIPLQMLVKYPFMVEIEAFEPPFLLEKTRREMEKNLRNAHKDFAEIVTELAKDEELMGELGNIDRQGQSSFQWESLKNAVPPKVSMLEVKLKENNKIIIQMIDFVTKYGTLSPFAQIFKVDTDKLLPSFNAITDKLYKAIMAGTVMSHAMALGGQIDKVINKIEFKDFDHAKRAAFTNALHQSLWKLANPLLVKYFVSKHFYLKHIIDPKMNPSQSPVFLEHNKKILTAEIQGNWEIIKQGLDKMGDENTQHHWQNGQHLHAKMQNLGRQLARAEMLGLKDVKVKMMKEILQARISTNPKQQMYLDLLDIELKTKSAPDQSILKITNELMNKYINTLDEPKNTQKYANDLKKQRQEIIEYYALLKTDDRKALLADVGTKIQQGQFLVTSPQAGLLKDLQWRAQSPSEQMILKQLIKTQENSLNQEIQGFSPAIQALIKHDLSHKKSDELSKDLKDLEKIVDPKASSFQQRIVMNAMRKVENYIAQAKINDEKNAGKNEAGQEMRKSATTFSVVKPTSARTSSPVGPSLSEHKKTPKL